LNFLRVRELIGGVMKAFLTVFFIVILLLGCASVEHFEYKDVTYKEVQKQVFGYGFSKSMNEKLAANMAEATARKNIAEQTAGMHFSYTNINGEKEMKLSIRNAQLSEVRLDKTIQLDKTGVLISVLRFQGKIQKPVGESVFFSEMRTQFSDDLLKISKSRTNVLQNTIESHFPKAHEVKGFIFIDTTDVGWNINTGVIQYFESYSIVIESVI